MIEHVEEITRLWRIKRNIIKRNIWARDRERERLLKEKSESFNLENLGLLKEEVK